MQIDQVFSQLSEPQPSYQINIDKSWSQGRTVYGGMSASLVFQAMQNLITDTRKVRSVHINFVGPLDPEKPIHISAEILREGKSVTQLVGKAMQNGEVATMVQACFGHSRDSKLYVINRDTHAMPMPKKAKFIPQIPKVVPKFLQHFDLALEKGALALAGNREAVLHGWCRFAQPPEAITTSHLINLMDCWPPTMLQMLRLPAAASTMSWNIEFIQPDFSLAPTDWVACQCSASHIQDGYGHEEADFWDAKGNLIAKARQVVTIFA